MTVTSNQPTASAGSLTPKGSNPSAEEMAAAKARFAALLGIQFDSAADTPKAANAATQANATTEVGSTYEVSTDGLSLQISKKGSTSTQAAAPGPLPTRVLPIVEDAAAFGFDPVALIQDRLRKQGVDPSTIQFSQVEETNTNPVGPSLKFHYVRAQFANGQTETYATEWVLYNPDTTAGEITSLIRRGFQPA